MERNEGTAPTSQAGAPPNRDDDAITAAMVAAGEEELSSFNLDFASREEAVTRIYRRMRSVRYARPTG